MTIKSLQVGALGWQHANWVDTYYPEDLPEDWQLDFYSHHFNIVLLAEAAWLHVMEADISQWLDDVEDEFRFLFAIDADGITAAAIKQIGLIKKVLKQSFVGVIIQSIDDNPIANDIQSLTDICPVFVDDAESSDPGLSACWRKGSSVENASIGFIAEAEAGNLREVRASVEEFLAQCAEGKDCYLIFEGSPPSTKTMQDTQIIIQMLT